MSEAHAADLLLELEKRPPLGALSASEHVALLLIFKNRRLRSGDADVVLGANGAVYRIRRPLNRRTPPSWTAP